MTKKTKLVFYTIEKIESREANQPYLSGDASAWEVMAVARLLIAPTRRLAFSRKLRKHKGGGI